jgi:integrase
VSWYEHGCAFVDARWPRSAPRSRQSRADALATVTLAMMGAEGSRPGTAELREALYGWAFIRTAREGGPPPARLADAVEWLRRASLPLAALEDATVAHAALDALAVKADGKPASANTIARKRAVFYAALKYAIELGRLQSHPLDRIQWTAPKVAEAVDRRVVVDHGRARALFAAVRAQGETGRRLEAFFGCMYYSALRPGEAVALTKAELDLPAEGWGEMALHESDPTTSRQWTDDGVRRRRQLKHRGEDDVRFVPVPPQLTLLLRRHMADHGTAPDGRLFWSPRGGPLAAAVYGRAWRAARRDALTPAEAASPLAARPYDLRHAAVSTWLNAGVPATQVAEWAGHSVHVLLRVYAKCILGQEEAARRRIDAVLRDGLEDDGTTGSCSVADHDGRPPEAGPSCRLSKCTSNSARPAFSRGSTPASCPRSLRSRGVPSGRQGDERSDQTRRDQAPRDTDEELRADVLATPPAPQAIPATQRSPWLARRRCCLSPEYLVQQAGQADHFGFLRSPHPRSVEQLQCVGAHGTTRLGLLANVQTDPRHLVPAVPRRHLCLADRADLIRTACVVNGHVRFRFSPAVFPRVFQDSALDACQRDPVVHPLGG